MSTRGSTEYDGIANTTPDWVPEPVCPECMVRRCGCPTGDQLEAMRMQHYDGMGTE